VGRGSGAGALAGVLLAQPTPTNWLMSDVAWHVAKLALAADGAPLEDPILRVPTIYPFLFHARWRRSSSSASRAGRAPCAHAVLASS
jgi:hypothetical protein